MGGGLKNYLCYGEYPTQGYGKPEAFKYPRGVVLNRDLSTVHPVNPRDAQEIKEYIASSWYTYDGGDNEGIHPWAGETKLNYTGPKPPFETLEGHAKYSFLKTPRWKENPMEVGPLARLVVAYASGHTDVQELVKDTLGKLNVPVAALFSTLGRTAARGLDAALAMIWLKEFFGQLMERVKTSETSTFNGEHWEPKTWPTDAEGVGLVEAPRGSLAHWIKDPRRQDRQLSACRSDNLEWFTARCQGPTLLVRSFAYRNSGRQPRTARRDHSHHPFL